MTPKELRLAIRAFYKNKEEEAKEYQIKTSHEQKLLTIQAYQISRWVWAKQLDINKILAEGKKQKEMTDDEMLQQVKKLNALFGGEVVTNGEE